MATRKLDRGAHLSDDMDMPLSREELLKRMALLDEKEYLERQLRLRQDRYRYSPSSPSQSSTSMTVAASEEEEESSYVMESDVTLKDDSSVEDPRSRKLYAPSSPVRRSNPSSLAFTPRKPINAVDNMDLSETRSIDSAASNTRTGTESTSLIVSRSNGNPQKVLQSLISKASDLKPSKAPWEKPIGKKTSTDPSNPSKSSTAPQSALVSLGASLPGLARVSSCVVVNGTPTTTSGSTESATVIVTPVDKGVLVHGIRGCLHIAGNAIAGPHVVAVTLQKVFIELYSQSKYTDNLPVVGGASGSSPTAYVKQCEDVLWTRCFYLAAAATISYVTEVHLTGLNMPLMTETSSKPKEKITLRYKIDGGASPCFVSGCLQSMVATF